MPEGVIRQPSPCQFEVYLPWACAQLQESSIVLVTKVQQHDYVSVSAASDRSKNKSKPKPKVSKTDTTSDQEKDVHSFADSLWTSEDAVRIQAVYDTSNNLVQLKFDRNPSIPRKVIKIIALTIKFYVNLHTIVINRGLNPYVLYELCKFLPYSHITDIYLDNTYIKEANYYILLEKESLIRHLSLSRCSIIDSVVETIAQCLVYPLPASKTLSILNLSSNKITDLGASYLAKALRSNRQLSYLNLAGNMLTDAGADGILSILIEFPLTSDEVLASKFRLMEYLKHKNKLIAEIIKDLRSTGDLEKRNKKSKIDRKTASALPKGKNTVVLRKEGSIKSMPDSRSNAEVEMMLLEKAVTMVENIIGEFDDPFSNSNVVSHDDLQYCYGNNRLCYINVSYNSLTYITVKKLLNVLNIQKSCDRIPRGLVNVNIEGNNLPVACKELLTIDILLEQGLLSNERKFSGMKKRPMSKNASRIT